MKDKTEISEGRWVTAEWLEHLDWLRREVWPQETSYDAQDRLPKEESGQSSSTADGTPEINPKVFPPLDEASCSASYFIDYRVAFTQSVKAVREETNQNAIAYLINNGWIPLKVVNIDRKFPKYALGCVNMNHYDYDMVIADQMACLKHTQSFYHRCLVFASQIRGAISNLLMCRS
jgi:hypothetical protein